MMDDFFFFAGDDHVMVSDDFSSTADTPVTSVTSEDPVTSDVTSQGPSPPVSLDSSIDETDKTLSLLPQDCKYQPRDSKYRVGLVWGWMWGGGGRCRTVVGLVWSWC